MTQNELIFGLVLVGRLLLPLTIFRFPIVGIVGCLILDGVDQTIFQQFTTLDLSGYQSYDKALDVYYLSIAYIAILRNWDSGAAFQVARFLFYYRLAGVVLFESTGAQYRWLLLVFPNTFEYFFIFYELVRTRWEPRLGGLRFWVYAAGAIWVLVKLPQEYWIHVAQLDVTDTVRAYPLASIGVALLAAVAVAVAVPRVKPHVPPVAHPLELAARPLPAGMESTEERLAHRIREGRVFTLALLEKVVLVTLVSVIFVHILPTIDVSATSIALYVVLVVSVNSFLYLFTARRGWGIGSALWSFVALAVFNVALVAFARFLTGGDRLRDTPAIFFFIGLLTLIVSTYDRYRPVLETRLRVTADAGG